MHSCVQSRWVAEKMLWITAYEEGKSITKIARDVGVTRDTVYKWIGRYKESGISGLQPKKPGSKHGRHPFRLDPHIIDRVVEIHSEYGEGPRKIVRKLRGEGIKVSHMSVYRHLVSRGKIVPRKKKRKSKDAKLHVCNQPGEELQLDVMHVDPLPGTEDALGRSRKGFNYQYTLIDDCTRVQYALLFNRLLQDNTCKFLDEVVSKSPLRMQKIRMDNGSENQSKVRSFLKARRINWIYNKPSRPDQNGKVERVHRTDNEEFYLRDYSRSFKERKTGLSKYLVYYNNQRPHFGLGMNGLTPLQKLQSFENYKTVDLIM